MIPHGLYIAHQPPLCMGFPRQEYWNGWPFPLPGDLTNTGIEPMSSVSPVLQVDSLPAEPMEKPVFTQHGKIVLALS